jgi:cytidyltransferase-like protein
MKTALFPGAFDPVTNGHIDLMKRALKLFDRLIVAVGHRGEKGVLFSVEERMEMLRETTRDIGAIEVTHFGGLLVDFAQSMGADVSDAERAVFVLKLYFGKGNRQARWPGNSICAGHGCREIEEKAGTVRRYLRTRVSAAPLRRSLRLPGRRHLSQRGFHGAWSLSAITGGKRT